MNFYKLDYAIEKTIDGHPTLEQKFLQEFTGKKFPAKEAKNLWERVIDHKWYIGERLKRDVGLRVAAIDYLENFYEPGGINKPKNNFKNLIPRFFQTLVNSIPPPPISKNRQKFST
jgi:hypothetical protein